MGFPWFCKFGQVEGVEGKPIIGAMFFLSQRIGLEVRDYQ
jgi:hypothetical protein